MRALIIDDEAPARAALRGLLRAHPEIALAGEADTIVAATPLLTAADYDLVFLDIQLRGGTGFDLVPLVRPAARIVFVTANDQFALRAFEANALDYLVKPVRPERLAEAIRRRSAPRKRASSETTWLRLDGIAAPVRASFRYLPALRDRLAALGLKF
jgi:two-component system, LytTR family, response regulator